MFYRTSQHSDPEYREKDENRGKHFYRMLDEPCSHTLTQGRTLIPFRALAAVVRENGEPGYCQQRRTLTFLVEGILTAWMLTFPANEKKGQVKYRAMKLSPWYPFLHKGEKEMWWAGTNGQWQLSQDIPRLDKSQHVPMSREEYHDRRRQDYRNVVNSMSNEEFRGFIKAKNAGQEATKALKRTAEENTALTAKRAKVAQDATKPETVARKAEYALMDEYMLQLPEGSPRLCKLPKCMKWKPDEYFLKQVKCAREGYLKKYNSTCAHCVYKSEVSRARGKELDVKYNCVGQRGALPDSEQLRLNAAYNKWKASRPGTGSVPSNQSS